MRRFLRKYRLALLVLALFAMVFSGLAGAILAIDLSAPPTPEAERMFAIASQQPSMIASPPLAPGEAVAVTTIFAAGQALTTDSRPLVIVENLPGEMRAGAADLNRRFDLLRARVDRFREVCPELTWGEFCEQGRPLDEESSRLSRELIQYEPLPIRNDSPYWSLGLGELRIEALARDSQWYYLSLYTRDYDTKVQYLKRAGVRGRIKLGKIACERVWGSFRSIGPDFRWPWAVTYYE